MGYIGGPKVIELKTFDNAYITIDKCITKQEINGALLGDEMLR